VNSRKGGFLPKAPLKRVCFARNKRKVAFRATNHDCFSAPARKRPLATIHLISIALTLREQPKRCIFAEGATKTRLFCKK
jgi:hypothetical protein